MHSVQLNQKSQKNINFSNSNFCLRPPPPKGGGLRQIKFFSFSETLLNIHVFQKLGIIPVSWHETENRGVGALDNCFHQVLSSHWFRGDTCDQMLGFDWRRFHFLTWNWKRWKGDGMRSNKIWSRNFPVNYHCKIGNYSNS